MRLTRAEQVRICRLLLVRRHCVSKGGEAKEAEEGDHAVPPRNPLYTSHTFTVGNAYVYPRLNIPKVHLKSSVQFWYKNKKN